jgi:cytochrome P450
MQTIISASHHAIHHNPSIFADPENFDPERWLGSQSQKLEKYLLPFSKGPRACLGIK